MPLNPFKNMLSDSLSMTNKTIKRGNNPTGFNFRNPNIVGMNQGGDSGLGQGTIMGSGTAVGGEWNPFTGGGNLQPGFTPDVGGESGWAGDPVEQEGEEHASFTEGVGYQGQNPSQAYNSFMSSVANILQGGFSSLNPQDQGYVGAYYQGQSSPIDDAPYFGDIYLWLGDQNYNWTQPETTETTVTPETTTTPETPSLLDNLVSPTGGGARGAKKLFQGGPSSSSYGEFAGYGDTMIDNLIEEY